MVAWRQRASFSGDASRRCEVVNALPCAGDCGRLSMSELGRKGLPTPPMLSLPSRPGSLLSLTEDAEHSFPERHVDICFVFDTTGSMNDKIDGLVGCMIDFVGELAAMTLSWQISVVPFGDLTVPGDSVVATLPFTGDPEQAKRMLREMPRNSGGGNEGESVLEAMDAALRKEYRPRAVKMLIVITDEPALGTQLSVARLQERLVSEEVIVFVAAPDISYYREWGTSTGGRWFPISAAVSAQDIVRLLRRISSEAASVASAVYSLAGGSVASYRALPRGGLREG